MKKLLILFCLLGATLAHATNVSGTVSDSTGQIWANGRITATLVNARGGQVTLAGVPLTQAQQTVVFTLNSSAAFSGTLLDNTTLQPIGTQWTFSVCSWTIAGCVQVGPLTITGTSQSLTSQMSGLAPPSFPAGASAYGYVDSEVYPVPTPGGIYYNVLTGYQRIWNGTAWANNAGGGGGGSGIPSPFTPEVLSDDGNGNIVHLSEFGTSTSGGVTTVAWAEDENAGYYDVRRPRNGVTWATNAGQALVNTMTAAMCNYNLNGIVPTVHMPAGTASLSNISVPPIMSLWGSGHKEYGTDTVLQQSNAAYPMLVQQGSLTYTCPSGNVTFTGNGAELAYFTLNGLGTAASTDVGLYTNAQSGYIHNMSFTNFGGPGRNTSGLLNNRGDHIFAQSNLYWYYYGGTYNTSSFADASPHCQLFLNDVDSHWDHIETYGQLQDSGYYNRYYLSNVCLGGGQASWLHDSFLQIAPHNIWYLDNSNGAEDVSHNRLDDSWWDSIHIGEGAQGVYAINSINGFCTSPTLNPANWSTNPGGISTDPNCSGIEVTAGGIGAVVEDNTIDEDPGVWAAWPVGGVWVAQNNINQVPTVVREPPNINGLGVIGYIGGNYGNGNQGADIDGSRWHESAVLANNTGTTLVFGTYYGLTLLDSTATNYTTFSNPYFDIVVQVNFGGTNDTITPSANITTCSNATLTSGSHLFWIVSNGTNGTSTLMHEICP